MMSLLDKYIARRLGNRQGSLRWKKHKSFKINKRKFYVERLIGEGKARLLSTYGVNYIKLYLGSSAVVYEVRSQDGTSYALKRIIVNNLPDLILAKQEIAITVSLIIYMT